MYDMKYSTLSYTPTGIVISTENDDYLQPKKWMEL